MKTLAVLVAVGAGLSLSLPAGWLMLEEHLHPRRRRSGSACSIGDRKGWSIEFSDHHRAFYAYLYPGRHDRQEPLRVLDSLRVDGDPG